MDTDLIMEESTNCFILCQGMVQNIVMVLKANPVTKVKFMSSFGDLAQLRNDIIHGVMKGESRISPQISSTA